MAGIHAIGTITLTIVGLLDQARSRINVPGLKVEPLLGSDFKKGVTGGVGLSVYLYRLGVTTARRNLPPRLTPDGKKLRPPLPVDACYMLSAWAKKPEIQHYILGWAMRTLEDTPTFSAPLLNGFDPTNKPFADDETVDLVFDPLSIQDMLNVWEVGKPNIQPSVTYVARVVPLDSIAVEPELVPVQTRNL